MSCTIQARQAAEPRSITDLEVRHAVLNDRRKRRSYFYLRETLVPELPPNATVEESKLYAEFVDPEPEAGKLTELKNDVKQCMRPDQNMKFSIEQFFVNNGPLLLFC